MLPLSPRRTPPLPALALVLATLSVAPGCASTAPAVEGEPYHGALLQTPEEKSIGFFMTELDARLRAWSNYKLTGHSAADRRTRRLLETELRQTTRKRFDDLLFQLETGPPKNRAVAAMAIGFASQEGAQSALLAALSDPDEGVLGNALIGLGLLALPDTPLAEICFLLGNHPDPFTRSNAAYCLQRLTEAGAEDPCVLEEARDALYDTEPGVRAQCAATLGLLEDTESLDALGEMLANDEPLAKAAAARALALIGRAKPRVKGRAARHLVKALDGAPIRMREALVFDLMYLSETSFGDDAEAWRQWAFRLD